MYANFKQSTYQSISKLYKYHNIYLLLINTFILSIYHFMVVVNKLIYYIFFYFLKWRFILALKTYKNCYLSNLFKIYRLILYNTVVNICTKFEKPPYFLNTPLKYIYYIVYKYFCSNSMCYKWKWTAKNITTLALNWELSVGRLQGECTVNNNVYLGTITMI